MIRASKLNPRQSKITNSVTYLGRKTCPLTDHDGKFYWRTVLRNFLKSLNNTSINNCRWNLDFSYNNVYRVYTSTDPRRKSGNETGRKGLISRLISYVVSSRCLHMHQDQYRNLQAQYHLFVTVVRKNVIVRSRKSESNSHSPNQE